MRRRGWALIGAALVLWAIAALLLTRVARHDAVFGVRRAPGLPPASAVTSHDLSDCTAVDRSGWSVEFGPNLAGHVVTVSSGDAVQVDYEPNGLGWSPYFSNDTALCFDGDNDPDSVSLVAKGAGSVLVVVPQGDGAPAATVRIAIVSTHHESPIVGYGLVVVAWALLLIGLFVLFRRRTPAPTDMKRADDADREEPFDPDRAIDVAETTFIAGTNPFGD